MSQAKMTPGPWTAIGTGVYQDDKAGDREIVFGGHMTRSAPKPEREANARAIACLPELVEAARLCLTDYDGHVRGAKMPNYQEHWKALRCILARIEGDDNAL